ncbi:MAG: hypothetical protein J5742_04465 [Alphaproteobacteria bacterium]|nr:hypothetical protein [Alphaproteobacteria bacterium]
MKKDDIRSIFKVIGLAALFFSPFVYHVVHQKYTENKIQKNRARIQQFTDYTLNRLADDAKNNMFMFYDYYVSPEHLVELRQDSAKYANNITDIIYSEFKQTDNFDREFNRIKKDDGALIMNKYKHICYELELARQANKR